MQFEPTTECKLCRHFNAEVGHCEKGWDKVFCDGDDFQPKAPLCPYCDDRMVVSYWVSEDGKDIVVNYTCDCKSIKLIESSNIIKKCK